MAFVGPGTRAPGTGNPDFWIKNLNDIYYNPTVSGNVGVGTVGPMASCMWLATMPCAYRAMLITRRL